MDLKSRVCWKCKVAKLLPEFGRNGLDNTCKVCRRILSAEWAKKNPDKIKTMRAKYMREYRKRKK